MNAQIVDSFNLTDSYAALSNFSQHQLSNPGHALGFVPNLSGQERYLLQTRLGHGGPFQVLRAWDVQQHRDVAIKILRRKPEYSEQTWTNLCENFQLEAKTMSLLKSENVVKFYDFFQRDDALFLVMEYLDGVSLGKWLHSCVPSLRQFLYIVSQVSLGLHAIHRLGFVHRDIKPENIMVTHDKRVVLIDFGITYDLGVGYRPVEVGLIRGTPGYMAPEQISARPLFVQTDIYSLGVVMFEMLARRPLFEGTQIKQLLMVQMKHDLPNIRQYLPDSQHVWWRRIEDVISRCLKKRMNARFSSIEELWVALFDRPFSPDSSDAQKSSSFRSHWLQ